MSLPSGGSFSIGLRITCLSFSLPVDRHVLNEAPCWGEPFCRVSDYLFESLPAEGLFRNKTTFWGEACC